MAAQRAAPQRARAACASRRTRGGRRPPGRVPRRPSHFPATRMRARRDERRPTAPGRHAEGCDRTAGMAERRDHFEFRHALRPRPRPALSRRRPGLAAVPERAGPPERAQDAPEPPVSASVMPMLMGGGQRVHGGRGAGMRVPPAGRTAWARRDGDREVHADHRVAAARAALQLPARFDRAGHPAAENTRRCAADPGLGGWAASAAAEPAAVGGARAGDGVRGEAHGLRVTWVQPGAKTAPCSPCTPAAPPPAVPASGRRHCPRRVHGRLVPKRRSPCQSGRRTPRAPAQGYPPGPCCPAAPRGLPL